MQDNLVRVGKKEVPSYLMAIAIKLGQGMSEVRLVGYGRNIEKVMRIARLAESFQLKTNRIDWIKEKFKDRNGKEREIDGVLVTLKK